MSHHPDFIHEAGAALEQLQLVPHQQAYTYEQLLGYVSARVNYLLANNFAALVQLLYTMDVDEEKLRYLLEQNKGIAAGQVVAALMIERQVQKAESRRRYKSPGDIPDEEKW